MFLLDIDFCSPKDLASICQIERESFPIPWEEAMFRADLGTLRRDSPLYLGARGRYGVVGYLAASTKGDSLAILRLGVLQSHRRCGVASQLLLGAEQAAQALGCRYLCLEVRSSNEGALAFYQKFGFLSGGEIKKYYRDNGEDAVLLRAALPFLLS